MSDLSILWVCLVAMVLLAAVTIFALCAKGHVKAGGKIGPGSFFIDASEKQKDRRKRIFSFRGRER